MWLAGCYKISIPGGNNIKGNQNSGSVDAERKRIDRPKHSTKRDHQSCRAFQ